MSQLTGHTTATVSLDDAIDLAVTEGMAAAEQLQTTFDQAHERLAEAARLAKPWRQHERADGKTAQGMAAVFVEQVRERDAEIGRIFKRQRAALGSVNLVLFGRTGAGKSSLIEAMTHGDGSSVSPGPSDWTKEVIPAQWRGCKVFDTPGTNGWAEQRSELEEQARRAVEIADVVLLCFDTQSQQQSEFQKVADWIRAYGKPAIAVLNCRNARWRLPPRVSLSSARRTVADQVRQHEGHIRDELTKLCLENVPVVAISSKRALYARAREPFKGPDPVTFEKQRRKFGAEKLFDWSNLGTFESLLAEALLLDAPGIRLGMLVASVGGLLQNLESELQVMARDADEVGEALDSTICGLLRVLGYPGDDGDSRMPFVDQGLGVDLLADLERLRGGRFEMPAEGEFQAFCAQLLSTRFATMHSRALAAAEELVLTTFNRNQELASDRFNREVFHTKEIEGVAKEVLDQAGTFLQRKVRLAVHDGQTDLSCLVQEAAQVDGGAGTGWRWAGKAARAAGLLSGAASAMTLTAAALNIWNPGGWVLAGVSIGGAILSWLFGLGGKAAEKKAEEKRAKARRDALGSARQHVNDTFDAFVRGIAERAAAVGRATMAAVLIPPLREAVAARRIVKAAKMATASLARLSQALPKRTPQAIIADAARRMEKARGAGRPGRWLWLGEDWIDDPVGLVAAKGSDEPVHQRRGPRVAERIIDAIRDAFSVHTGRPRRGDGQKWLERSGQTLSGVPGAVQALAEARRLLDGGRPRLMLAGDYNTGKSSFIKRLLVEAGHRIPKRLRVRADPTTQEAHEYDWDNLVLIDSPGLQSGRESDEEAALRSLWDASHVICLFQPNVLGSTVERLAPVLRGNPTAGLAPKLGRSLLVLNRSDELGVDPTDDPDEFDRLASRKKLELINAFSRLKLEVPEGHVLCMASDPFGLVGDRTDVNAAQYDKYRAWDGFNAFVSSVKELRSEALRVGAEIAVLEGGMARLGALRATRRKGVATARPQLAFTKRLYDVLEAAASESSRIRGHIEARLDALLDETAQAHLQDAMGAATDEELQEAAKALAQWWKDKSFKTGVERWEKESRAVIDRWFTRTRDEVGRRMQSKEFLRAHPEAQSAFDAASAARNNRSKAPWWKIVESASQAGGTRSVVYDVAKFFGAKFRPWGAIKVAAKIGKVSAILAYVGVALDAWDWYRSAQSAKQRESARKEAARFLQRSRVEVRASLLGGEGKAEGPTAYLADMGTEIARLRDVVGSEVREQEATIADSVEHIDALTTALADGRARLGLAPEEITNA